MRVEQRQVYEIRRAARHERPAGSSRRLPGHAELRDAPWTPVTQPRLAEAEAEDHDMFAVIRQGDVLVHHPFDSFSDVGRALRRAGRQRPGRARDQADRVPHERRLAARAGADPRDRARQAGGLPRGAEGALRRAREHHVGAQARGGGRPRRLRHADAEDARQVPARRAPRGRRRAPLRARRHRQLPRRRRRGSTPTSDSSRATSGSAPTSPTCSTS